MPSDDRRLLLDGATDLEALLLKAAQTDTPDPDARARTIENIKSASHAAALVGGGFVGARWFTGGWAALSKWLIFGGIGMAVVVGVVVRLASRDAPPPSAPVIVEAPLPAPLPIDSPTKVDEPKSVTVDSLPKVEERAPRAIVNKTVMAAEQPETPPEPRATPAESIREETAFLENVRRQVEASQFPEALASLRTYDTRFGNGVLAEEAAVLRVKALAASGSVREAQQAVEAFERRYPRSSYLPRVRALVKEK